MGAPLQRPSKHFAGVPVYECLPNKRVVETGWQLFTWLLLQCTVIGTTVKCTSRGNAVLSMDYRSCSVRLLAKCGTKTIEIHLRKPHKRSILVELLAKLWHIWDQHILIQIRQGKTRPYGPHPLLPTLMHDRHKKHANLQYIHSFIYRETKYLRYILNTLFSKHVNMIPTPTSCYSSRSNPS
jgi:hypothetical protein